jgi:hypothetical protein
MNKTKQNNPNLAEPEWPWLTPVILDTWEAEIKRIAISGYPRQKNSHPIAINSWAWWCISMFPNYLGG